MKEYLVSELKRRFNIEPKDTDLADADVNAVFADKNEIDEWLHELEFQRTLELYIGEEFNI